MLVQQRGSCQVKVGSTVGKYHICAGTGLCFELGYKLGNRLMIRFLGWGVAVNYGHPPARCARVPLRGAKGGNRCLVTVFFVAALLSLESGEGFCVVYLDSLAMLGGLVLGEGVSECVGFVGALHPVGLDDVFGFE